MNIFLLAAIVAFGVIAAMYVTERIDRRNRRASEALARRPEQRFWIEQQTWHWPERKTGIDKDAA